MTDEVMCIPVALDDSQRLPAYTRKHTYCVSELHVQLCQMGLTMLINLWNFTKFKEKYPCVGFRIKMITAFTNEM